MLFICELCNARLWLGFPHLHWDSWGCFWLEAFFLMPKPGRDAFLPFSGFNLLGTPHNSLLLMQSLARPVEHYS